MFKLGRGGGGRGKRPLPPAPPTRTAVAPGLARMPPLGGRGRAPAGRGGNVGGAPAGREESFSLLSGEIDFAAIIRLAPDLVEEIRRLEAQGGAARIKFDSISNFTEGNVIDVGGKEFRFTWSREPGDLCDIYEERQTGEDGDGLLVERGSAWRKLNVNRVLDESTKNHVKMRSEEAERLSKARRAIVVDPTKNQVKSMAAAGVDGSMRRMNWKQKKEPLLRKGKIEPHQASNSGPKSASKLGIFSNKSTKSVFPVSPISSPMQTAPDTSSLQKCDTFSEEIPSLYIHKERIDVGNIGKEIPGKVVHGSKHEVLEHKDATGNQLMDLQNVLLTLLSQNPKGMSLKALEKEVGETIPNAGKNIESIIKNIATYEAPERYVLKPGPKVENSNKGVSENGSSPESAPDHISAFESFFGEGTTKENYKDQVQVSTKVEESDPSNRIDSVQDIRDPVNNDKKDGNDSEGKASSSESGSASGSESDSSDSESDSRSPSRSRSKSKSRSPVGSASASSSDSESDGSSSSKEGSDIHVDIMTSEDEKEQAEPNSQAADLGPSSSLRMCRTTDDEEQIDIIGRDEEIQVTSSPIDLNEFGKGDAITHAITNVESIPIDNSVKTIERSENQVSKHMNLDSHQADFMLPKEEIPFSKDKYKQSEDHLPLHVKSSTLETNEQVVNRSSNEKKPAVNDRYGLDLTEQNNKRKSKRTPVSEYFEEKPESDKRSKGARSADLIPFGKTEGAAVSRVSDYMLPDKSKQDQTNINNVEWAENQNIDSQEYSLADRGRSVDCGSSQKMQQSQKSVSLSRFDVEEQVTRASDFSGRKKSLDKVSKNMEGMYVRSDMTMKDKSSNNIRDENTIGEKMLSIHDSHKRKSVDHGGIIKDNIPLSQIRKYDLNNSPLFSAQGIVLRRELSDLELGEFREIPGEDIAGVKRHFERNSSFKSSDKTVSAEDYSNTDTSKGRIVALSLIDSKQSSTNWKDEVHGNQEESYRKLQLDDSVEPARAQQRAMLSQNQSSKVDHADTEIMCHPSKSAELVGQSNMRTNGVMSLRKHTGSHKKTSANMLPQPDINHDGQRGCTNAKESKSQRSNTLGDSTDRNNNTFLDNDINGRKKRESSSDDSDSFYSTYDKEEPELRGPIKDYMQYKEYVQEYREKYKCYISLNKNLENIRDKFLKVGEDVDFYKGRDMEEYYKIIDHLRDMYHQQGPRNKQMKKVFTVLHEELKTLKQRIQDFAQMYGRG